VRFALSTSCGTAGRGGSSAFSDRAFSPLAYVPRLSIRLRKRGSAGGHLSGRHHLVVGLRSTASPTAAPRDEGLVMWQVATTNVKRGGWGRRPPHGVLLMCIAGFRPNVACCSCSRALLVAYPHTRCDPYRGVVLIFSMGSSSLSANILGGCWATRSASVHASSTGRL